jgi:hypothetical protein
MFGEFDAVAVRITTTLATSTSSRIRRRRGVFTPLGC